MISRESAPIRILNATARRHTKHPAQLKGIAFRTSLAVTRTVRLDAAHQGFGVERGERVTTQGQRGVDTQFGIGVDGDLAPNVVTKGF